MLYLPVRLSIYLHHFYTYLLTDYLYLSVYLLA